MMLAPGKLLATEKTLSFWVAFEALNPPVIRAVPPVPANRLAVSATAWVALAADRKLPPERVLTTVLWLRFRVLALLTKPSAP
jgi:hypothetical protein